MKTSKISSAPTLFMILAIIPLLSLGILSFKSSDKIDTQLSDLKWLVGTWENAEAKGYYATWEYTDNALLGRTYKLKKDKEKVNSNMTIKLVAGKLVYTEQLVSKKYGDLKSYKLNSTKDGSFVFADSDPEFPTEITLTETSKNEYHFKSLMRMPEIGLQATAKITYNRVTPN